jgi:hypothetical protein
MAAIRAAMFANCRWRAASGSGGLVDDEPAGANAADAGGGIVAADPDAGRGGGGCGGTEVVGVAEVLAMGGRWWQLIPNCWYWETGVGCRSAGQGGEGKDHGGGGDRTPS